MAEPIMSQLVALAVSTSSGATSVTEKFYSQPLDVGPFNSLELQVTPKATVAAPGTGAAIKIFVELSNDRDNWVSATGATVVLTFNDGEAGSKFANLAPGAPTFNVVIGAASIRLRIEAVSGTAGANTTTIAVLAATVEFKRS